MKYNIALKPSLTLLFGVIIAVAAIATHSWVLSDFRFFYADDWGWLYRAHFYDWWRDYFKPLPGFIYNDRPVGAALIKLIYSFFGLNHKAYAVVFLSLHIVNCIFLYRISRYYLDEFKSALAAVLSAVWIGAHEAVIWTGAVFDILSTFFCLAAILSYLNYRLKTQKIVFLGLSLLCYFLAIRTKEFGLGLIGLILMLELYQNKLDLKKTAKTLWPYALIAGIIFARYLLLLLEQNILTSSTSGERDYALALSLSNSASSLKYYFASLLNLPFTYPLYVNASLSVGAVFFTVLGFRHCRFLPVFCLAAFIILLGPVLLLSGQNTELYLYAPHFFFALGIASFFPNPKAKLFWLRAISGAVVTFAILYHPYYTKKHYYVFDFRRISEGKAQQQYKLFTEKFTTLQKGQTIFVVGIEQYTLNYNNGFFAKIYYDDINISVIGSKELTQGIIDQYCETTPPKDIVEYQLNEDSQLSLQSLDVQCTVN